jgi:hypothetical protein
MQIVNSVVQRLSKNISTLFLFYNSLKCDPHDRLDIFLSELILTGFFDIGEIKEERRGGAFHEHTYRIRSLKSIPEMSHIIAYSRNVQYIQSRSFHTFTSCFSLPELNHYKCLLPRPIYPYQKYIPMHECHHTPIILFHVGHHTILPGDVLLLSSRTFLPILIRMLTDQMVAPVLAVFLSTDGPLC